jgi:hypothetical protein
VKKLFRLLALALLLIAFGFWAATGANRGWTKNLVEIRTPDEVTGIDKVTYEKKFIPGVDFLAVAVAGAGALMVASFFFRKKNAGTASQSGLQNTHT